jgi:WD repeat-containing protein 68
MKPLPRLTQHCVINFSNRPDPSSQFRLAIGSYVEQYSNAVQIVKKLPGGENYGNQLYQACEFDHPYPCTKILWSPDTRNLGGKDLLATTGDYLRVWNISDDGSGRGTLTPKKEALLNNVSIEFNSNLSEPLRAS